MSKVVSDEVAHAGRWIHFRKVVYQGPDGVTRVWEAFSRSGHHEAGRVLDAVLIFAVIRRKHAEPEVVLVKQFRPPSGKVMIELPAGLADTAESAVDAARREMAEETGYQARFVREGALAIADPDLENTAVRTIFLEIDGDAPENQAPKQHLDEGEFLDVFTVPLASLPARLDELRAQGFGIDALLAYICAGLELGRPDAPALQSPF